uniref:Uncharacterized protein n=1 Tax=Setaria viridis TaxID=4556 RepID=A0A4U6VCU4_SETVI|nr:hypothetical protein SEVIR_3G086550v2 [Setaria viridis]
MWWTGPHVRGWSCGLGLKAWVKARTTGGGIISEHLILLLGHTIV